MYNPKFSNFIVSYYIWTNPRVSKQFLKDPDSNYFRLYVPRISVVTQLNFDVVAQKQQQTVDKPMSVAVFQLNFIKTSRQMARFAHELYFTDSFISL